MKRFVQAACVAGAVLFSAVGCSHCCGSKSTSACPDGQCPPGAVSGPGTTVVTPGTAGVPTRIPVAGPGGYKMPGS